MSRFKNNNKDFEFIPFSTQPPPPPYPSRSMPLPGQHNNTSSRLNSTKEYVSHRIGNISAGITTSLDTPNQQQQQTKINVKDSPSSALKNSLEFVNSNTSYINAMDYDTSLLSPVDDSLERIGHSLQYLIDEAEASLLGPSNDRKAKAYPQSTAAPMPVEHKECDTFADYSYGHIQQVQRQDTLTVAIDALEQNVQPMEIVEASSDKENAVTHFHHYVDNREIKKKPSQRVLNRVPSEPDGKRNITLLAMLLVLLVGYLSLRRSCSNRYGKLCLVLVVLSSVYRKNNYKRRFPVMNTADRFIIRLVFSKGTTPWLRFIHRSNILYHCITRIFL